MVLYTVTPKKTLRYLPSPPHVCSRAHKALFEHLSKQQLKELEITRHGREDREYTLHLPRRTMKALELGTSSRSRLSDCGRRPLVSRLRLCLVGETYASASDLHPKPQLFHFSHLRSSSSTLPLAAACYTSHPHIIIISIILFTT